MVRFADRANAGTARAINSRTAGRGAAEENLRDLHSRTIPSLVSGRCTRCALQGLSPSGQNAPSLGGVKSGIPVNLALITVPLAAALLARPAVAAELHLRVGEKRVMPVRKAQGLSLD